MTRVPESLREQAARLFSLALEAKERGDAEQADLLIAAASRCIDRAIEAEAAEAQAAGVPPPEELAPTLEPPPVQQQQQIQPTQKDTGDTGDKGGSGT
jgi:hypothetical protein